MKCQIWESQTSEQSLLFLTIFYQTQQRNELTMVPLPKPKFAETNVPIGKSIADYRKEIIDMQAHVLNDAIDRVSFWWYITLYNNISKV